MGQQQAQRNNLTPNKISLYPQMKITYIPLQLGRPLPSTAGEKDPNAIWKFQPKQNLAIYFAQPLENERLLFKFSNSITPNGAIQVTPHNKIKPHENPVLQRSRHPLQQDRQNENRNRI
jgi:hypothetical protein